MGCLHTSWCSMRGSLALWDMVWVTLHDVGMCLHDGELCLHAVVGGMYWVVYPCGHDVLVQPSARPGDAGVLKPELSGEPFVRFGRRACAHDEACRQRTTRRVASRAMRREQTPQQKFWQVIYQRFDPERPPTHPAWHVPRAQRSMSTILPPKRGPVCHFSATWFGVVYKT